jgi:hypothetical protein
VALCGQNEAKLLRLLPLAAGSLPGIALPISHPLFLRVPVTAVVRRTLRPTVLDSSLKEAATDLGLAWLLTLLTYIPGDF